MVLWLLGACALRATVAPSERDRALAEVDAAWAVRAEPGNLDAAMDRLLQALALDPADPAVLARLARSEWTRAYLEPGAAHFEIAQDYGYRCLLGWAPFASRADAGGYLVSPETAKELPAEAAECLTWTVAAGLGQVELRGSGGALELEALAALIGRLADLDPADAPGFADWAQAKLLLLQGSPDTQEVRRLLGAAIGDAPGVLLFRVELADALPDARNVALEGFEPPAPDPWALENTAWRARLSPRSEPSAR
ncbi:MAG: hypothetical protein Q8P41_12480 [Pseudomonadota bacterium]|nr:hypothetical protein [Pseudomonadota bacterium]